MKKFLWQVEPDWTNGITETLEWKTDILQSYSGAEQRIARRLSPRRTFEFSILINGNERARFENKLAYVGGNSWYFPIFTDVTYLETDVDLNTTVLPCSTTGRDFVIGNKVLIKSEMNNINRSALLEIADVNENSITLINPLKSRFTAGACIYPVRLAVLTDVPQLTHYNDDLLSAQIRFRISEHNAFSNDISYLPIYRHFPVLTMYPDWSESLKGQYERFLIELDNGSSIPTRLDTAKLPFWVQEFRWFVTDRTEQMLLRKLFYYLTGSQKCIWVSTQISDFNIIAVNGQILDIENVGFYEIGLMPGRKDVVITLCNGDVLYRRIETVAAVSDEIERLLLNDSINVNAEDILSVSFLTLCRLDSDSVSWEHVTDADGLANITCSFRGIRDELESI
ncbi:phage tail protein [Gilliamella apicola]|uniref:phage tail protein n=1 Tax=Gilliamella apicola TaxID=1196095 RepID=UPI003985DB6F